MKPEKKALVIPLENVVLGSSWTSNKAKKEFITRPTTGSETREVKFTVPSGCEISDIVLNATPANGIAISGTLTVNGTGKHTIGGAVFGFYLGKVLLKDLVTFEYTAYGNTDEEAGGRLLTLTNVSVNVEYYEYVPEQPKPVEPLEQIKVVPPPNTVYVYTLEGKKLYTFDGVSQVQHSNSVSIEENPDNKKKKSYINNAKNEPDKVVIDVVMSDIYGKNLGNGQAYKWKKGSNYTKAYKALKKADKKNKGAFKQAEGYLNRRSSGMFRTLLSLKESRELVMLITPQHIYEKMLVASVTATQSSDVQFGWEGQITFQGGLPIENAENTKRSKTTIQVPSPSAIVTVASLLRGS